MRKRQEEERVKGEQVAANKAREVMQRLRMATPDTVEQLKTEMQNFLTENTTALGSQHAQVQDEANKASEAADDRVKQIAEQNRAEEERKKEAEKAKAESEAATKKLMEELEELVKQTEVATEKMEEAVKPIKDENNEMSLDAIQALIKEMKRAAGAAKTSNKAAMDFLGANRSAMEATTSLFQETRQGLLTCQKRIFDSQTKAAQLEHACTSAKDKSIHKARALKDKAKDESLFKKYDKGNKKRLDRKEVNAYAKAMQSITLSNAQLDKIFRILDPEGKGGIVIEKFHRLRTMVGIVREEGREEERRAEREEQARIAKEKAEARAKELEELKEALQSSITEATEAMDNVESEVSRVASVALPLIGKEQEKKSSEEQLQTVADAEALIEATKTMLEEARHKAEEVSKDVDPDLKYKASSESMKLANRARQLMSRLQESTNKVMQGRKIAEQAGQKELRAAADKALNAIKEKMTKEEKNPAELFGEACSDKSEGFTEADFTSFVEKELGSEEAADKEKLSKIFRLLDTQGAGKLTEETFIKLMRHLYKVKQQASVTDAMSIKDSKAIRRLEPGEIVECIESAKKDEGSEVVRIKARCIKDGLEGWVTITGNQGTSFLEHLGSEESERDVGQLPPPKEIGMVKPPEGESSEAATSGN